MESLEHNCGNISQTICTNMLIFGKKTYLVLISRMISQKKPISSQNLIFVTSHFHSISHCVLFGDKLAFLFRFCVLGQMNIASAVRAECVLLLQVSC